MHQPLIISMVAGFVVVKFTSSRRSFLRILHDSSEPVYIAFFTLTGMTLQIETLLPNLPTALLIFTLRLLGICVGAFWGGKLGGAPKMHYERFWMTFVTQAGVTLGLAQRIGVQFADSFGSRLALCVTAEVVFNQLVGPLLFKAAILGVGEAHTQYEPHNGPGQLGISAPSRPKPRSGVLVAASRDPEAVALRSRLVARGWELALCELTDGERDDAVGLDRREPSSPALASSDPTDPAFYTPDGAGAHTTVSLDELLAAGPRLGASASARRAARLKQLVSEMGDAAIVHRLAPLVSTADAAAAAAGVSTGGDPAVLRAAGTKVSGNGQGGGGKGDGALGPLAEPLLAADAYDAERAVMTGGCGERQAASSSGADVGAAAGGGGGNSRFASELRLLWAIASLESLDTLILLLPTDADSLNFIRLLETSASLLPLIHQRQTSTPQILMRIVAPEIEPRVRSMCPPGFELTAAVARAAMPNLLAEVLHPDCHWSKELDNAMD